jgi:DnaJ-class molecular chaperone
VLGVDENTTMDELKASYKSLVLSCHPDRNSAEDSAQRFVEIREAWEILSDAEARQCYDKFLSDRRYNAASCSSMFAPSMII